MQIQFSRRGVMLGCAATIGASMAGCAADGTPSRYEQEAGAERAPLPKEAEARDLVRFATLAANSHNTQAWRFRLSENRVDILPDSERRTPVVDPDDHHLFASLGAAAENLTIAAAARGLKTEPVFAADGEGVVHLALTPSNPEASSLFQAITERQSTRADYDSQPLPSETLRLLEAAGTSDAVDLILLTQKSRIEAVLALILAGNSAQMHDAAFMRELKLWIRFNEREALSTGDGLFAGASGSPALPSWLGRLIFGLVVTADGENDKAARQIRSSSGLAIFVSKGDDPAYWVAAGRAGQRFALTATALGLKHAFVNQAVEVPSVRTVLAKELGVAGRRPDLIMRFGHGPDMPRSLRRPLDAVIL